MSEWITQAQREQLARDLADLPDLVDQLERHYPELLGRGERGGEDPQMRYPARLSVLDLADNRPKRVSPWRGYLPNAAELHAFARDVCGGVRRRGVIQELGGWVRMAHEEMQQDGAPHSHPATSLDAWAATTTGDVWPTCIGGPTVTTEAGWLRRRLDWICGRQWVDELADDMRRLVADLEVIVGPAYAAPCQTVKCSPPKPNSWSGSRCRGGRSATGRQPDASGRPSTRRPVAGCSTRRDASCTWSSKPSR